VRFDFGGRLIEPELMDDAAPDEARACLEDLVRLNQDYGGHSALRNLLLRAGCQGRTFSLLDIGAASGDAAEVIRQIAPGASVVNLDRNPVNLGRATHPKVLADAFQLPFRAGAFDYVFSSLFLHHFTDEQIILLLSKFSEVARRQILISDLERHLFPYVFLPLSKLLLKWHWMAAHDGRISVRAALTAEELRALAEKAGLKRIEVTVHRPAFRLTMLASP
jgi:SAM-dependent methyltransferase